MRYLFALAISALAVPAFAQENEAEKLFRAFEKKLGDAKAAYKLSFDVDMTDTGEDMKLKGDLLVANGNQLRLSFVGSQQMPGGKPPQTMTGTIISDGRQLVANFVEDGKPNSKTEDTPAIFGAFVKGYITKVGLFKGLEMAHRPQADKGPDKLSLTGFKMGGKEKIGNVETQIIEYILAMPGLAVPGEKQTVACKLWLDVKTNMAVKRTLEVGLNGQVLRMVESYSDWQIDPKLKGDEFTLPK